jgi:Iap family predicted aminopeptidase
MNLFQHRRAALSGALLFFTICTALPGMAQLPADQLKTDISGWMRYLTEDRLRGRVEGTPENREVTDSIARYFREIGLQPFGSDQFKQTFYTHPDDSTITVSNVIAWLPGTEQADEFILISAHFDHVQIGFYDRKDKIYNGANDNASGTSVMLAMARQLALTAPYRRSILFCAFNAEEAGLVGSQYFAERVDADKIVAGINLEMLGYPLFGRNTLMLTGMGRSNLHGILKKGLSLAGVKLRRERGDLFERSDNYSLAQKGVPAHTLMASDDREKCYHRPCDELERMDIDNMTSLCRAILTAINGLIEGVDTPARIQLH